MNINFKVTNPQRRGGNSIVEVRQNNSESSLISQIFNEKRSNNIYFIFIGSINVNEIKLKKTLFQWLEFVHDCVQSKLEFFSKEWEQKYKLFDDHVIFFWEQKYGTSNKIIEKSDQYMNSILKYSNEDVRIALFWIIWGLPHKNKLIESYKLEETLNYSSILQFFKFLEIMGKISESYN